MMIYIEVFVLYQVFTQFVNGLVYAGYKTSPKVAGISSLDRHRCGEMYLGFEFTGYMISADGSCVGIPYNWSGVLPVDSELIQKSWNYNLFKVPLVLFREGSNNYSWYNTQIPGDVTSGSRVEVVFVPKYPWSRIVFNFKDSEEIDVIIRVSFRKDFSKMLLNSYISDKWTGTQTVDNLIITNGKDVTLTLEVLDNAFKVSVDGIEKYNYPHIVDPEKSRTIEFHPNTGSNCLLKSFCFYELK